MEPIVPLISSSVSGPLGAKHLPRLWLKIVLHAAGRLPEGYRHGSGGLDEVTLTGLGIDAPAFIGYLESEMPSYQQCEAWVRAHAANIGPAALAEHNARIDGATKPPASAAEFRQRLGVEDPTFAAAVPLNDLDDWSAAHAAILRDRDRDRSDV
jgi:hypothetical protein